MAEQNTEIIFKVGTEQAVKNIADLKKNVTEYKKELDKLPIGSEEYGKTLERLQESQAALKNAMHATTIEGETQEDALKRLTKDARGAGTSYNSLVKQMADLTQQFRATEDAAKRVDLGKQILDINQQLKALDALRGNFQRNVGDYLSQAAVDMKSIVQDLPSGLKAIRGPLDDVTKSLSLMGKQPILGMAGLLAPIIIKITESLKDNKSVTESLKKVLDAMKPALDLVQQALAKVGEWVVQIIDWVTPFMPKVIEGMKNIVVGAVGVGNAILQFLLTPIRTVIDAAKGLGNVMGNVFKGQFKEAAAAAKTAIDGIGDAWKKGFSFATNFEEGKKVGEEFLAGLGGASTRQKAEETGTEIGTAIGEKVVETMFSSMEKAMARERDEFAKLMDGMLEDSQKFSDEIGKQAEDDTARILEEMQTYEQTMSEYETRMQENRKQAAQQIVSTTSSLLGSLADMIESGTEVNEKEARRAKNLRIASATIDMFQGATTAYSTAQSLGVPMGPIVGAINAAAVIATGMANIAKIKSQNVSASSSSTGVSTPTVSTPAITPQVAQVRTITSASEEDRLNQMASDQRVYILNSDLEAAANSRRVLATETSF